MAPSMSSTAAITALLALSSTTTAYKTKTVYRTKHTTHTKTVTANGSGTCSTGSSAPSYSSSPPPYPSNSTSYWPGWSGIQHLITFGDSYSTTGFNTSLAQPSIANPLGNPAYPGYTATNGPNWVDFLTTTYNATFITTLNLAYGGATIDNDLVEPYLPTVLSLKAQIQTEYLPLYASAPEAFPWKSDNTLFAAFLGINDVGNAYGRANASDIFAAEFVEYAALMDTLYQTGARNFLFLNVPPVNLSPLTKAQGAESVGTEALAIAAWNRNVTALANNLTATYADAEVFVFDTNAAFTQVLDNPASHPETAAYRNTTDYCESYMNGTPTWYTFYENCSIPVDEYFWLNTLHPTFRMMNVTAQEIVRQLEGGY